MQDGKDALLSVTNIGAIASLIMMLATLAGAPIEYTSATAVATFVVTVFGRWRKGDIKSVAGVSIPQPAKPEGQL